MCTWQHSPVQQRMTHRTGQTDCPHHILHPQISRQAKRGSPGWRLLRLPHWRVYEQRHESVPRCETKSQYRRARSLPVQQSDQDLHGSRTLHPCALDVVWRDDHVRHRHRRGDHRTYSRNANRVPCQNDDCFN